MKYKFVFNANLWPYDSKQHAARTARECGYMFFVYNETVYTSTHIEDTGIREGDLF
jgi:hypothetical protein